MSSPGAARLLEAVRRDWPDHGGYLDRLEAEMTPDDRRAADSTSDLILKIAADDLPRVCADYRWLCGQMQREQLHFARHGEYRLKSFEQARREVYDDEQFMARYINGLLIGRITWIEQLRMLRFYADEFLAPHPGDYEHLEVGPGHGLLLYLADQDPRCSSLTAVDVSRASLEKTDQTMRALGSRRRPRFDQRNIVEADLPAERWQSIVVSEVLEHLERPDLALDGIAGALTPGGRAFITSPANCPMPDHIYLFQTPEEIVELVEGSGLQVLEHRSFTGVGISEARARSRRLPIACAVIAARPRAAA